MISAGDPLVIGTFFLGARRDFPNLLGFMNEFCIVSPLNFKFGMSIESFKKEFVLITRNKKHKQHDPYEWIENVMKYSTVYLYETDYSKAAPIQSN
jgi:hypothetical protein